MAAPVVWFEVAGRDLDTLTEFYADVLGWKIDVADKGTPNAYGMVDTGSTDGIPGGVFAPPAEAGEWVTFYVQVDDLEATLERAERKGAKVTMPPTPIPTGARIAQVDDPEGHRIVLITAPGATTS